MGEDGGGRRGTAGDHMSDVSWFQPGGTEGPSAKTIVPYSPSGPYPPGIVRPSTPKKTNYEP